MTEWADFGRRIARLGFPALGGAVAGPGGAAFGRRVAEAFGVEQTPSAIDKALAADPAAFTRLAHLQQQFDQFDAEMEAARESRLQQSVGAARDRNDQDDVRFLQWFTPVLVLMSFTLIVLLFFFEAPETNQPILFGIIGTFLGFAAAAMTYWYGSSRGSASKQQTMDRAIDRIATRAYREG